MLQDTQVPVVLAVKLSLHKVHTLALLEQPLGRQLGSSQAKTHVLLVRVLPGSQVWQRFWSGQKAQPEMLQRTQELVLELKLKPLIQAEQTLFDEQAEQLVLLQVTQEPLLAENPWSQAAQKLSWLQEVQLETSQRTQLPSKVS